MMFTLRQLAVFEEVARTLHFGKAADLLGVSQPTVSSDIRALEKSLGIALFDRSRTGTALSVPGAKLVPSIQKVLEAVDELREAADRLKVETVPTVRLAATPSVINRLVPAALRELASGADRVSVHVLEVATGGVSEAISMGRADVGVGHFVDEPRGCSSTTIGFDQLWLLTKKGQLSPDEPAEIGAMGSRKLLIWPREQNSKYYDFLMDICTKRDYVPAPFETPTRISGSYSYMLTSGQAFSIVPKDFAEEAPQSLSCAPLTPPARLPLRAVWRIPAVPGVGRLLTVLKALHHVSSSH